MNDTPTITRQLVAEDQRLDITAKLFGNHFPLHLEPFVFFMADTICEEYNGGYWEFYSLSDGGFFMAPTADTPFHVSCENGYEGDLSATAFGIVCCLYAYSHLSFSEGEFAQTCAEHYHLLRQYMFEQPEVDAILRAVD